MLEEVMTTKFKVGFSLTFVTARPESIDFDDVLSRFYDELLDLEERCSELMDPDLTANLVDLTAEVEMIVEADSFLDAQVQAITIGRTALHTIEVGTPGWEAAIAGITAPCPVEEDLLDA